MRDKLEVYYNKFNEDKRLTRKHGNVEFVTSMHYITRFLKDVKNPRVADIGAGTGRYSIELFNRGVDVLAIEPYKCNLNVLKQKNSQVKTMLGNALNLKKIDDKSFDLTLLFGPMYHLATPEEKLQALNEAKRITKIGGTIMVAYCMNDYCIITHGFKDHKFFECKQNGMIDQNFHTVYTENDLYSYVTVNDINNLLNSTSGLKRELLVSADGPANYIRQTLNQMTDEEYQEFINYHLSTCERQDLIGASAHTIDILTRTF